MRSLVTEFAEDATGSIALMFGLGFFVMVGLVGVSVDLGRWLNARNQTIAAMDAAVLAGGRCLQLGSTKCPASEAIAVAQRYYNEATKNRIPTESDSIQFQIANNGTAITAAGNAYIQTPMMNAAMALQSSTAYKRLALLKTSAAEYSVAQLAVGGNSELNLEISMMLDVSGSMTPAKMEAMKNAAKDLVEIVVWQDQSQYTSKVALVPFSADVRPPASFNLATYASPAIDRFKRDGEWFGRTNCVGERRNSERYTDAAPIGLNVVTRVHHKSANDADTSAPCATALASAVVPLTSTKTTLINAINGLQVGGGTAGHIGTAWAFYTLSPKWNAIFTGVAAPSAYGLANTKKIAVLMTDGEYNYTYFPSNVTNNLVTRAGGTTEAGSNSHSNSINATTSAAQAVEICKQMKGTDPDPAKHKIEVYTVGFDLGGNQTAINTLNACASSAGHAYKAENPEDLKQAFRDIALKISQLYLKK